MGKNYGIPHFHFLLLFHGSEIVPAFWGAFFSRPFLLLSLQGAFHLRPTLTAQNLWDGLFPNTFIGIYGLSLLVQFNCKYWFLECDWTYDAKELYESGRIHIYRRAFFKRKPKIWKYLFYHTHTLSLPFSSHLFLGKYYSFVTFGWLNLLACADLPTLVPSPSHVMDQTISAWIVHLFFYFLLGPEKKRQRETSF